MTLIILRVESLFGGSNIRGKLPEHLCPSSIGEGPTKRAGLGGTHMDGVVMEDGDTSLAGQISPISPAVSRVTAGTARSLLHPISLGNTLPPEL